MNEIRTQSNPEFMSENKAETIEQLKGEITFYKQQVLEALEKDDFSAVAGLGERLRGIQRQIEHWEHWGISKSN